MDFQEHLRRLAIAEHSDPFAILGRHADASDVIVHCFVPGVSAVYLEDESHPMERVEGGDLFRYRGDPASVPERYRLLVVNGDGDISERHDAYAFPPVLADDPRVRSFSNGTNYHAQEILGAHRVRRNGIDGVRFAVWAPNARSVSVVGAFNGWDGRCHPMHGHIGSGIWELFIPQLASQPYKYEIHHRDGSVLKTDPYARAAELRPSNASLITAESAYPWGDRDWMSKRETTDWLSAPLSVYEVHLGSWLRSDDHAFLGYEELARRICDHVVELGFTHIEILPVTEHPLDDSWGYQVTGYFAPTSRHGTPDEFRAFVDHCHRRGIGVILDFVPAHFPRDAHGLAYFDGEALYEYHDPWKAEHRDWGTLIFNYERYEVRSFLISSALYWLQEFHLDGLRVDAVASMLYLNFSRQEGQWVPNRYGGHHNLEAIEFVRELNDTVHRESPGCLMIAEESTDWHGVTRKTEEGGLGFDLKWNMGWMHDTLNYFKTEPLYRKYHHEWLTFGPLYAFNENFMLPFSHDEVVHLKKSLFGRMRGHEAEQFAGLRLLYAYQWFYPGKKLLFMGGELAQETEWDANGSLPWHRKGRARGIMSFLSAINKLMREQPALHRWDTDRRGFEWLDGDDKDRSVIVFMRHGGSDTLIIVLHFTPVVRKGYAIPLARPGTYREIFNSDHPGFDGQGNLNSGPLASTDTGLAGRDYSLKLNLPALGALVLKRVADPPQSSKRRSASNDGGRL